MHRSILILAAVALIAALHRPPAAAQTLELEAPRARQGYFVALGAYGAVSHAWERGEALGVWGGWGSALRMGQMVTERLGLGLVLDLGESYGRGQRAGLGGLGIESQWELARNLALHASVGLGVISLERRDGSDGELRGTVGAAYTVGASYDWFPGGGRRSGGWSISPALWLRAVPGEVSSGVVALAGVQLSFWSGLPRNQLQLPDSEAYQR